MRGRIAYREAVKVLRDSGATGAIVLAGVDGLVGGRRRRARLFSKSSAPMVTISIGPPEPLRRSMVRLARLLPRPVVTLERIAQVKHDGRLLEPPPSVSRPGRVGFSSDEPPHGDKLGGVASHRPTYMVYIDRPRRVAMLWPMIHELTAEHGIVTSLIVPDARERARETTHGSLVGAS